MVMIRPHQNWGHHSEHTSAKATVGMKDSINSEKKAIFEYLYCFREDFLVILVITVCAVLRSCFFFIAVYEKPKLHWLARIKIFGMNNTRRLQTYLS
jgi:hypothetical protein